MNKREEIKQILLEVIQENFGERQENIDKAKSYAETIYDHLMLYYFFPNYEHWKNVLIINMIDCANSLARNYKYKNTDINIIIDPNYIYNSSILDKCLRRIFNHLTSYKNKYNNGFKLSKYQINNKLTDLYNFTNNILNKYINLVNKNKGKITRKDLEKIMKII